MSQYYTLLTPIGLAKVANAQVTQSTVAITQIAVGDGNGASYAPSGKETTLKNEKWRGAVTSVSVDNSNSNWVVVDAILPGNIGGFFLREVGLFDLDGDLIAIGNYPDTYKPVVGDGSIMDLTIRTIIEVDNASSVTLKIDPNVIIASRPYVDGKVAQVQKALTEHSAEIATTEKLGHFKPDGKTIKVDSISGVASAVASSSYYVEARQTSGTTVYNVNIPDVQEYKPGLTILIKLLENNKKGAAKLNINNLGEVHLIFQTYASIPQNTGELASGRVYQLVYDGLYFTIIGVQWSSSYEGGSDFADSPHILASYGAVGKVNAKVNAKANKLQESMQQAVLQSGWAHDSSGPLRFFKDQFGIVHLTGGVQKTSSSSLMTYLPVGYRPEKNSYFICSTTTGTTVGFANLAIQPDGVIGLAMSANFVFINISFRAA